MTIKKSLAKDGDSFSGFVPEDIHAVSSCFSDFEEIAEDTYCVVLKAKKLGRWYAVKALKPQFRESMQHKALLRKEYTLLATLHSPYVVKVYDFQDITDYGTCIGWNGSTASR